MSEHTPTPWTNQCFQVYGADKSKIAHTGMGQLPPYRSTESEANAAFIVKAANSHDALVKALEEIAAGCDDEHLHPFNSVWAELIKSRAREALAKVQNSP